MKLMTQPPSLTYFINGPPSHPHTWHLWPTHPISHTSVMTRPPSLTYFNNDLSTLPNSWHKSYLIVHIRFWVADYLVEKQMLNTVLTWVGPVPEHLRLATVLEEVVEMGHLMVSSDEVLHRGPCAHLDPAEQQ